MAADGSPEIIWVAVPAALTSTEVDRTLHQLEGYLRRKRPYFLLFDLGASLPDATQRKKLTDHMRNNQAAIDRLVLGLGVVVPSPLARNLMTAILWFAPPHMPHRIFSDRADADAWALALRAKLSPDA
jgi:hypothetical protein